MKRAQIELTFHWIYILIAGAVILLFFVGIVMRQKTASDQRLSSEVLNILDSLFSSASVAEKTKEYIDISGISRYQLTFSCADLVSRVGIEGSSGVIENNQLPLFSPAQLRSSGLLLWSVPFSIPFKATDLLLLAPSSTSYVLIGQNQFSVLFQNASTRNKDPRLDLAITTISSLDTLPAQKSDYVRLVDTQGSALRSGMRLPEVLDSYADNEVTGVSFLSNGAQVQFFKKQGAFLQATHAGSLPVIGLAESGIYAALFSGNEEMYSCNMQKALRRAGYVAQVYGGTTIRSGTVGGKIGYLHDIHSSDITTGCATLYEQMGSALTELSILFDICSRSITTSSCYTLQNKIQEFAQRQEYARGTCPLVY